MPIPIQGVWRECIARKSRSSNVYKKANFADVLMESTDKYAVKDLALAEQGKKRVEWAKMQMPIFQRYVNASQKKNPLKEDYTLALHVTKEIAVLVIYRRNNILWFK